MATLVASLRVRSPIRVLVVDDSVVVRKIVSDSLKDDPQIEVVGTASNGSIALQRIRHFRPDVVTLDIEMPEMDGLETLRRIRKDFPEVHVIMLSSLTERGAAVTIEALASGAKDYLTKPSQGASQEIVLRNLKQDLLLKVKQFFVEEPLESRTCSKSGAPRSLFNGPLQAWLIGVSTGGPNALSSILPMIPASFPLPILIVQHMPPMFTKLLAERLQSMTALRVCEASDGQLVEPGQVLIAPGDFHMKLRKSGRSVLTELTRTPPENSCRPAVDVLFRSAAEVWGGSVIATILTGMGQDGLRGAETLYTQGAYVIAQDEQSSVVWGMPGYIARAGLADAVLPLTEIVPAVLKKI